MGETVMVDSSQTRADVHVRRNTFLLVFLLGLLLYMGLNSTNYDGNDMIEMIAVKAADNQIFSPNHLAYRPLALLLYRVFQAFGYSGNEIVPAHLLVGIPAALAIGLIYLWMTRLVKSNTIAVMTALAFGTSWAYWVYSISLLYFVPSILPLAGALIVLWMIWDRPKTDSSRRLEIILGLLTAGAILFWQAHIFLIPMVLLAMWLKYRNSRAFIMSALVYVVTAGAVVGFLYIGASLIVLQGNWSVKGLLDWVLNYGSSQLNTWGVLDFKRIFVVPNGQVSSILPIWDGLGLRDLLRGQIQPDKIPAQVSIVALVLIVGVGLLFMFRRHLWSRDKRLLFGALIVGYLIYMPFIVWWDPTEPLWFIVPNIALWAMIGIMWDSFSQIQYAKVGYGALVVVIALGNFTTSIWPRHAKENPFLATASCVADHASQNDLVITATWNWTNYSKYFFDQPLFNLIDYAAHLGTPEAALASMSQAAAEVWQRGGTVYIQDSSQFDPDYYLWLAENTGLTQQQLTPLQGDAAFTCSDMQFNRLAENS